MSFFPARTRISTVAAGLLAAAAIVLSPLSADAHCDSQEGPTVIDGREALESGNVNHALPWVAKEDEVELKKTFESASTVRELGDEAQELADQYFLENLVRLHRSHEGAPYTGIKPEGTPIEPAVAAADKAIAQESIEPLHGVVEDDRLPELEKRLAAALDKRDHDVNDVEAAREYIVAYVNFFKYAEGEEHAHEGGAHAEATHGEDAAHGEAHGEKAAHSAHGQDATSMSAHELHKAHKAHKHHVNHKNHVARSAAAAH